MSLEPPPRPAPLAPLTFGRVVLRPRERRVLVDGREAALGARAFDLLMVLVEHRERLVGKQELLDRVWPSLVVEEANLSVQVAALRKVLGPAAIATVPGRGYQFTLTENPAAGEASPVALAPASPPTPAPATADLPSPAATGAATAALACDPLVGREDEVYDIVARLQEGPLVTVVGAGGIGKTRLGRAVLQRLREDFAHGAWWVDLVATRQAPEVAAAIARALGAPLPDGEPSAALATALAPRSRMLLVLDNCEQATPGVAAVVNTLLGELPMLRVLATSRMPLHLGGEQVWRVEALAVPAPGASFAEARRCAAFELLERRLRRADQRLALDAAALPLAIEVCRRLEGHPLSIEMAAARAAQIGLPALVQSLDRQLQLLRSGDPLRHERQADLRRLVDWSWSLLDELPRRVLQRLSVFAGSFRLPAAQAVAAGDDLDRWEVLDAIGVLVDHSLVQVFPAPGDAADAWHYRLAAPARLVAQERLAASADREATGRHHRQAMVALAGDIAARWWTASEPALPTRFGRDADDLLSAFDAACADHDAAAAGVLAQALALLDAAHDRVDAPRPRRDVARRLLDARRPAPRDAAGLWLLAVSDPRTAGRSDDDRQAVAAWRASGDRAGLLRALAAQARACLVAGDVAAAASAVIEIDTLVVPADPCDWRLEAAIVAGEVAGCQGGAILDVARRKLAACLAGPDAATDPTRTARAWLCAAALTLTSARPDPDKALDCIARAQAVGRDDGGQDGGRADRLRCAAHLWRGDVAAARRAAREAWPALRARLRGPTLFAPVAWLAALDGQADVVDPLLLMSDRWHQRVRPRRPFEAALRAAAAGAHRSRGLRTPPDGTAESAAAEAEACVRLVLGLPPDE